MANDYGFRVVWKGYRDRGSWCCCWLVWFLRCCSRRNSACERGVASALTTPRLATRSLALPPSLQCSPCVCLYLCLYSFSEETMHAKYVAAPSQIAHCNRKGPHLSSDWCIFAISPHTCQRAGSTMTIGGWRTSTELYLAINMRNWIVLLPLWAVVTWLDMLNFDTSRLSSLQACDAWLICTAAAR
jgi:hypothetical protein